MDFPDVIDLIRPSIIQVIAVQDGRSTVVGSGFIIDTDGHVATAAHVADGVIELQTSGYRPMIGMALPNAENATIGSTTGINLRATFVHSAATFVGIDRVRDVAVLRFEPNPFAYPPSSGLRIGGEDVPLPLSAAEVDASRPRDGESVAISGFPLESPTLITTSGHLASVWYHDPIDPSTSPIRTIPGYHDSYVADLMANPGNSGGPAYRMSDGIVLGVCVAFRSTPVAYADGDQEMALLGGRQLATNTGLAFITPIGAVLDLLHA